MQFADVKDEADLRAALKDLLPHFVEPYAFDLITEAFCTMVGRMYGSHHDAYVIAISYAAAGKAKARFEVDAMLGWITLHKSDDPTLRMRNRVWEAICERPSWKGYKVLAWQTAGDAVQGMIAGGFTDWDGPLPTIATPEEMEAMANRGTLQ